MKNKFLLLAFLMMIFTSSFSQQTIQEKLGYSKDAKLLILHADDLGVSHSEDSASIHALEKGDVSSGSIMVPCPWFSEMADYAKSHPDADLGVHLTLTSEWKNYKWSAVASKDKVSSLLNTNGYFFDDLDSLKNAKPDEVETELRSQIEKAIHAGIYPTHLDSHMGSVFFRKDFLKIYLKLAHEYHLPCLLNVNAFKMLYNVDISDLITDKDVLTNIVYMVFPPDNIETRSADYEKIFQSLTPGLNCILLHAAYDNDEMKAITQDHPDYGAAWRQADYDFFTSDECKKALAANNIHLVTWKEVKDKIIQ
ncbi:MAG TPA: polysaccharide deacetylase family protein [Parafilimonas sp.]|nr:polysaccharide deacetylase family protein [Parafilimonas sp.]